MSLNNKYYIALEHGNAVSKENLDKSRCFCNTSENSIEQLTIFASNNYAKLKIEKSSSKIAIKHIGSMFDNLKSIKSHENIEKNDLEKFDSKIVYLNSCYQNLKKILPEDCIIGIVDNIDELFNEISSIINNNTQCNFSECIQKLTSNISQINCSLNIIINFINILQTAQLKFITFLNKAVILLNKIKSKKFILQLMTQNDKKEIDLRNFQLKSIICDQNQNPIFVYSVYKSDKKYKDPIESFSNYFIKCVREFQRKTDLETFIFKHYERLIQNPNLGKNIVYIDDYIKKNFTSLNNELTKMALNYLSKSPSIENLTNGLAQKIQNFKIMINEDQNITELNNPNSEYYWHNLIKFGKYHFPQNKNMLYNLYKLLIDQIPSENPSIKNDSIQGMFIKLTELYQNKDQNYFFEILYRNAIPRIIDNNRFSQKLQEVLKSKEIDDKLFFMKKQTSMSHQSYYNLCFDKNFNFYLKKDYFFNQFNDDGYNVIEREKKILSSKYSKFIVHSNENAIGDIIIPYYPNGTIGSIIANEFHLSYVDKIVIILEIATALKNLHENGEYHGNLSDEFIFISFSKDAYLDGFSYDSSSEETSSMLPSPYFYRSPKKDDQNENENENVKNDIFSFGVLMYVILTEKTPQNRVRDKRRELSLIEIKNNYFDILLNDTKNEVINENIIDHNGDSLVGIKDIIKKCLEIPASKRYESMQEIINCIKDLAIYEKNKEEIEYRIENAPDSSNYQCNLSDIVGSYYHGNKNCLDDIKNILKTYSKILNVQMELDQTNIIKSLYNIFDIKSSETTSSILEYLITLFIQNDKKILKQKYESKNSTDFNWFILLNKIKYFLPDDENDDEYNIKSILDKIFKFYIYYIGKDAQTSFYEDFSSVIGTDKEKEDDKRDNSNDDKEPFSTLQAKFQLSETKRQNLLSYFNDAIKKNKSHYLNIIFHTAMKNILNQTLFSDKFHEVLNSIHSYIELHNVKDSLGFNEIDSSYKLFVDNDFNFVLQKTYNQNIKKEIRDREKNILKENYSKFIVHCEDDSQENKIIIPYFPCGNLDSLIRNQSQNSLLYTNRTIEFSFVDKIVIALEIGTALKDLHENNEFHGNLSSQFIFVNSNKDAYIGGIAYDRKLEADSTKPRGPFYYRPPEITYFDCLNQIDENIKKQQMYDIYSYGVLLHELITEVSPEKRMGNKSREERLHLLNGIYDEFLLNDEYNECFTNESYDSRGDNLSEFKKIIEKCLKKDVKDRYQTFNDIIDEIHEFDVYKKNKNEIDFRIDNAVSSVDYQCTISDIVETYYLGNESSIVDIEKALILYMKLSSNDHFSSFKIKNDVIQTIFDVFNIKYKIPDEEFIPLINEFNKKIKEILKIGSNQNSNIILNQQLYSMSLKKNSIKNLESQDQNIDFIFPISTLDKFTNIDSDLASLWAYYLSSELSYIHCRNMYHGELSPESIGIYFNTKTKTFIPSIILYYSFYKVSKSDSASSKSKSKTNSVEKYQNKDLLQLKKIISKLVNDEKGINDCESIDEITFYLYNQNINNDVFKKNFDAFQNYQLYDFTYTVIKDILYQFQKFGLSEIGDSLSFVDFKTIIYEINNLIEDRCKSKREITQLNHIVDSNDINTLIQRIDRINEKCELYVLTLYFEK